MRLSYSSINTYETCPAKYRFEYEDRLPRSPAPALSFGDSLHRALFRFHDRPVPVAPSLPELLQFLDDEWVSEGYRDPSEERLYRDHGGQVLETYHRENAKDYRIPAALEYKFSVEVEGVQLVGQIDRLDRIPGGGYEIIDYKTNRRLPPRSRVDKDLQLSLYWLAAREIWGIEAERLTLYYLLPGQRMTTTRTEADAERLRSRIAVTAERIEAGKFEARENPLCNWCDFQARCPVFRHLHEKEEGDPAPRITDLVDEWITLKREDRARWKRMEELAATIHAYCEEHEYQRLYGSEGAGVARVARHDADYDLEAVRDALEPLGLYEEILAVDRGRLAQLIEGRTLPPDVEDALLAAKDEVRTSYALYLREKSRSRR